MKRRTAWLPFAASVVIALVVPAYATNPPAVQWTKTFAGIGEAVGHYVEQTGDGGYFVAGMTFIGSDVKLLLVKTDASGNTTWTRTVAGSEPTGAFSAQQTADGGYIVGVNGALTGKSSRDIWLMKIDGQGDLQWQSDVSSDVFPYGGANGHSVVQTSDGGYAVSATKTLSDNAVMLFKTNNQGIREWFKRYPVPILELGTYDRISLRRTSDGGYIIGTRTLLKVDSQGNQQWLTTFSDVVCANSVLQTPDGGYVATGPTSGYSSIYLFKTNASGSREWITPLAPSSSSEGRWVERTADGGFVASGSYTGPENLVASVVRTTSSGTQMWVDPLCIGSAECVRQTQDGGYIVTGHYYVPASQYGTSSMFLKKLAPEQKGKPK